MKLWGFLLILGILLIPSVNAKNIEAGIYVLNLGRYDIATGSFTVDFYLWLNCKSNCSPDLEFVNGRASSVDKIIDSPREKFYRIVASLSSPVDLKKFPFDSQKMQILLEDKTQTIDKLEFVPMREESGLDESIAFAGWNIDGWSIEAKKHYYAPYNETYSQLAYTINISRIAINSFFKTFLPVFFMVLIVMFSFIMDPDKITTRLTITTSSLVASVMFHISVANQIPPVGYLTNADKFMILTYFLFLLSAVMNVIIMEFIERKQHKLAERIHRATEYSVFILVPLIYFVFFSIIIR